MQDIFKIPIMLVICCLIKFGITDDIPNGLRIEVIRQKSAIEQHLNSANRLMQEHGLDFEWVFKGPNRTNDSVALYRYADNEFYAKIVVGKPGQSVNVAFDTAWSLSWLLSKDCSWTNIACYFHNKYDHSKSSLYKKDGKPVNLPEGKYNLSGYLSIDTFYIAHSNVSNQTFAEIVDIPYTFLFNKIDGILGLGLATNSYTPFFYNLLNQTNITNPVFSIYLNRDKQSNRGGNILLGFIEKRHIHHTTDKNGQPVYDPIKYLPIKGGQYWQFDLDAVYFNGEKENKLKMCTQGCTAISDTSSNSMYGPADQVKSIHEAIGATPFLLDRYRVDCDTINKLPTMAFTLGGQNFTLEGRDYTIRMSFSSISICLSAFISQDTPNLWVLGGAFLSEYYSIYDIKNKQIGLVKSA